jgi:hypothetical protein
VIELKKKRKASPEPKFMSMEVDGTIELIPYRTIEEMEAACTISLEQMSRSFDEDHETELRLENEEV